MPPIRTRCDECNRSQLTCPDCGESTVSIDSINSQEYPPGGGHLSPDFEEFGLYAEEDDVLKYNIVCWDCGWSETKKLSVEIE